MSIDATPASLRESMLAGLPPEARDAVERLVLSTRPGRICAVGGTVRDLLLGRPLVDVDLVIEGDAIDAIRTAFASGRVTAHSRFRTASLTIAGVRIDVATARSETYARPGALPKVAPANIDTDLRRRDFTVNAIALQLDGEAALIDPFGGIDDLRAGRIRVLHDASFRDDATRIFRAFRYAARLGFTIDPHTRTLADDSIAQVAHIGGERLRRELELLLEEETGAVALEACDAAGALLAIHPALRWTPDASAAFSDLGIPATSAKPASPSSPVWRGDRPRARVGEAVRCGFALLAADASPEHAAAIVARLKLKRGEAAAVTGIVALCNAAATLARPDAKPSGIVVLLDRYPEEAVAAFAAIRSGAIAGRLALRYLADWRNVKPALSGRDLLEMGVPEGPRVHQGLQLLRAARLDGWAADRDDERALIMRFVKSIRDSSRKRQPVELHLHGD
jgi:tRNA nucleotidyltransferase (CCA-adding enzyme)